MNQARIVLASIAVLFLIGFPGSCTPQQCEQLASTANNCAERGAADEGCKRACAAAYEYCGTRTDYIYKVPFSEHGEELHCINGRCTPKILDLPKKNVIPPVTQ